MKKIYRYTILTSILYFIQTGIVSAACFYKNDQAWQSFKMLIYSCLGIISFIINVFFFIYEYTIQNITPQTPMEETSITQDKEITFGSKVTAQDCVSRTERYAVKYCNARNGQMDEINIETDYDKIRYSMKYCCKNYLFYVNSVNLLKKHDIAFYENGTCCTSNCTLTRNNTIQKEYSR